MSALYNRALPIVHFSMTRSSYKFCTAYMAPSNCTSFFTYIKMLCLRTYISALMKLYFATLMYSRPCIFFQKVSQYTKDFLGHQGGITTTCYTLICSILLFIFLTFCFTILMAFIHKT